MPRTECFPESPFQEALTEGQRRGERLRGSRTHRPAAFRGSIAAVRRSHDGSRRHHPSSPALSELQLAAQLRRRADGGWEVALRPS
jgi:hypothetical protein